MYAIVDIETTGGYAASNGITEIAILLFDGQQIVKRYETLINPGKPIPRFIQSFTGITDEMVSTAPEFNEVAQEIYDLIKDAIFVAHNVNFDYSFVKHHLAAEGLTLQTKKLCTVRLARKILPGFHSYGLGNLCNRLNIPIYARHRAMGDAAATAQLFQYLLEQDKQNQIEQSLQKNSKEQSMPLNLPAERLFELPKQPGVYYFYNKEGKVIYVGKARNLRKRVNSHFTNNNTGRQRQQFLQYVYDISYETCGTELMAVILESAEIKRLWPEFNRSQKNYEPAFGIYDYQGQDGYLRLGIDKIKPNIIPLCTFRHYSHALDFLMKCVNEYELCPKLSGVQDNRQRCIALDADQCKGACIHKENKDSYNSRIQLLIDELDSNKPTYVIKNAGRTTDEEAMLLVENGKFYGMGYVSRNTTINTVNEIKNYLVPLKENEYIRHLINRYADKHPEMIYNIAGG